MSIALLIVRMQPVLGRVVQHARKPGTGACDWGYTPTAMNFDALIFGNYEDVTGSCTSHVPAMGSPDQVGESSFHNPKVFTRKNVHLPISLNREVVDGEWDSFVQNILLGLTSKLH